MKKYFLQTMFKLYISNTCIYRICHNITYKGLYAMKPYQPIHSQRHIDIFRLLILDRNTWNHIIVCKFLVLDKNTWDHIIVCKLLVFDINTWKHMIVYKLFVLIVVTDS